MGLDFCDLQEALHQVEGTAPKRLQDGLERLERRVGELERRVGVEGLPEKCRTRPNPDSA